jgi:DNA repair exonuclease SbcCD nuclease subunit
VIHSPDYHPLADVPPRPIDTEWYVVVAHGHHVAGPSMGRSSPILSSELDQIDADYVALGHWHHATRIADRPPAWYSGWPRPAGPVGGALLVDLTPGRGPTVRELSLPTIGGSDASTD